MNDTDTTIKDFSTLLQIKNFEIRAQALILQTKMEEKENIENHFLNKISMRPFPSGGSRIYEFKIYRSIGKRINPWQSIIMDKQNELPWESILPYELIEHITSHPVDCQKIIHIKDIKHKGNCYNLRFIRYLDNGIVGKIHIIKEVEDILLNQISTLDIEQYRKLDEEKQIEIFFKYFDHNPTVRRVVLFHFFSHIMPEHIGLKEVI